MSTILFNNDELKKFNKIYKNLEANDEFEIMFGGYKKNNYINLKQFTDLLKYFKDFSEENKLKINHNETLDISYNYDNNNFHTYRITIKSIEEINKLMKTLHNKPNQVIFSILISMILNDNNENLSIINKKKNFENTYDLDEFDIRVRLSKEESVKKKELEDLLDLKNINKMSIMFRKKSRISLIIDSNSDVDFVLDLTKVKSGNDINKINNLSYLFEYELDFNKKKKLSANKEKEYLEKLNRYIIFCKKILEQSNHIISSSEKKLVMSTYNKLLYGEEDVSNKSLYGPNVVSLEALHIVEFLPNRYSITDKADGDRCLGIILNRNLYLIFSNLEIKNSGVKLDTDKYNKSILDGEYIFNKKYNKFIFALFDVLYISGENIQNEVSLESRYQKLNELVIDGFKFKYKFEKYSDNFNLEKIVKYYKDDLKKYLKFLMDELKKNKTDTFVCQKYFIFSLGGLDCEIFRYSNLMWDMYTSKNVDVPYILDGLIYTPLKQIYTNKSKEQQFKNYKWKPPNKNSIDFYVKIEKDENGNPIDVFDDSKEGNIEGNTYKILNLYVGKMINNIEIPTLFRKDENLHIAKISNIGSIIRDTEGDIIQDNTVIECYYNNDNSIDQEFRWVPIRTRFDKTESVLKYKRKYGNNADIANAVWNSIKQNITIGDLSKLGEESLYDKELSEIKKKIDAVVIAKEQQKNKFYQKITDLGKPLRDFHNYIKSNLIFTYCSEKENIKNEKRKLTVLDYGCGRGGDISKMFHARIDNYVGIDIGYNEIFSSIDGAISRYDNFRRKNKTFPKMEFLLADASSELNYESQIRALGKMSDKNKSDLVRIFGEDKNKISKRRFDVFNCQLMIHYLFKNDDTWNNFCNNVNNYLNDGGYLLITTFDGDLIHKEFQKNNGVLESYYLEDGKYKLFFKYRATYDYNKSNKIYGTKLSYESNVGMLQEEDSYYTEYLVSDKYIKDTLKERCNLSLIESESFYNIYLNKESFFKDVAMKEENKQSREFFSRISKFYDLKDSVNEAGLKFSKLHKYYVFKKDKTSNNMIDI
jgi:SAM-dependent methyltransferase